MSRCRKHAFCGGGGGGELLFGHIKKEDCVACVGLNNKKNYLQVYCFSKQNYMQGSVNL